LPPLGLPERSRPPKSGSKLPHSKWASGSGGPGGQAVGEAIGHVLHQLEPGVSARLEFATQRVQFSEAGGVSLDQGLRQGGTELGLGEQTGDIILIEAIPQFLDAARAGTAGRIDGD